MTKQKCIFFMVNTYNDSISETDKRFSNKEKTL